MKKVPLNTGTNRPDKLPKDQRIILDLAQGKTKPQNAEEVELLKEIKEIEVTGLMLDMPFE
jgi:hypothetical protein